jgi:hypothetical protein
MTDRIHKFKEEWIKAMTSLGMVHGNIHFTDSNYAPNCYLKRDTAEDLLSVLDALGALNYGSCKKKKKKK